MGPVLGGVGLGLVWGWWIVMVAGPPGSRLIRTAFVVGLASVILVAGVYGLAGLPAVLGLMVAAGSGVMAGVAVRAELDRAAADTR
jgi:hypothetical protein